MAFDGIITKAICSELSFLEGARIDKIFQPNKNNVIIGMYNQGKNYALNICTESSNCRIHLTTHPNPNPQVAPNFCMVLRKNLLGLHLKNIFTLDLERLVVIDFEGFDEVDDLLNKRLIIELMGKHSNIILLDEPFVGIDSVSEDIIMNTLRELRDKGKLILIVHHDLSKVPHYFDQVILLNRKLIASGPTNLIFNEDNLRKTYGNSLFYKGDVNDF